jgi:uncharacterized coiled-coil protein SlyX
MFNGGLQARNQGQLGTCYSESSTRLILKLFKHPEIKLLGDIKDNISSDEFKELQRFEESIVNELKAVKYKKTQKLDQNTFLDEFLKEYNDPQNDTTKKDPLEIPLYFPDDFKEAINELYTSYTNLQNASIKKTELNENLVELKQKMDKLHNEYVELNEKLNKLNIEKKIEEYNNTVPIFNGKVKEHQEVGADYNAIVKKYNEIDKNEIVEFNKSYNNLVIKKNDFVNNFNKDNTPEITKLLKDRQKFVDSREKLKKIIDNQNRHFNEINNFIILKFDTKDGASVKDIIDWFVKYVNDPTNFTNDPKSNHVYKLQNAKLNGMNTNNQCKQWDQDIDALNENCQINYTFLYGIFKNFHNKLKTKPNSRMLVVEDVLSNSKEDEIINKIETIINDDRYLVAGLNYSTGSIFADIFQDTDNLIELTKDYSNEDGYCVVKGEDIPGHAIVITGHDDNNFILKNSWGYKWGDFGKLKINKNKFLKNLCVINIYTINMIEEKMVPIAKGGISTHKYKTKRNRKIKAVINRKKSTKKIHKRKKTHRNKKNN